MSLLETLWREFLETSPSNADLCAVIKSIEPLRPAAWQLLLAQGASNDDLRTIIESVPSLKNKAQQVLWRNEKRQYLLNKMRTAVSAG